jgi:predicted RND superfamily exporter protein
MTTQRKLGAAIALVTAIGAATGVVVGYLNITPAVGAAVIGIVIGTGVARGMFSTNAQFREVKSMSPPREGLARS